MRALRRSGFRVFLVLTVIISLVGVISDAYAASRSHIGVNQPVLVICVRWSDDATTRLGTCTDWVNLLNNEVNGFYNRATFNQTNFIFETSPAGTWYNLGYNSTSYDFFTTGQDAINLIDPDVNMANYDRVLVITNWDGFGGQGGGPWSWRVNEGIENYFVEGGSSVGRRDMTMAIVNEWLGATVGQARNYDQAASVAAHELGHELDLKTHYGDIRWHPDLTRDVITPWDIMGISPSINHFIGWAKSERGWIPGWTGAATPQIETVGPPVGADIDRTITIAPQELFTAASTQVVRIPFTSGSPFHGYVLENRRRINGDENLPSEGILVSLVNERPDNLLKLIVLENPSALNLNQAPIGVGESFEDPSRNLRVDVLSQAGNNYTVRIRYLLPPSAKPDPMIIEWGAPPYETVDIWVDSAKNGFGTYRYTDGAGNPSGNGDDAWVNHDNRVYVKVRNIGPGIATNVRVQVYRNDPPGMGDAGPEWEYLGTILFPNIASGAVVEDYVIWKPTVGQHTCLMAVIENIAGELSTENNVAHENVTHFDTSGNSPYDGAGQSITVYNPFTDSRTPVYFKIRDIPPGWAVIVEPETLLLPPGGKETVFFMALPSGRPEHPLDSKQMDQRPGFIGKPKIEAYVPYADTFIPIGGVDLWTHLVNRTKIECEARKATTAAISLLSGRLIPAVADAKIAIELLVSGTTETEIRYVNTNAEGTFILSGLPSGTMKAWAYYSGDLTHSAAETGCDPMPVPARPFIDTYLPKPAPVYDADPAYARPFTGGTPEGGVLDLRVGFSEFTGPVDIYLALVAPPVSGDIIWMIREDMGLQPASAGVPKWRSNETGPIDEHLYTIFPLHYFPKGTYFLLAAVTPAGSVSGYYIWVTGFVVP